MIKVKLRQAMQAFSGKTGEKVTYNEIAEKTGLSKSTLEAIGSRQDYNTTLATINSLCKFFECDVSDLLEYTKE